ncbi:hypothetical protein BD410DRAFT_806706 [Rickenella mellea]|uniref:RNI-like protein n=1 Tax=Rickenella mellea TaxID=50990 RepID=A0A4Y7PS85_9AGAM|nr:hypothetical protein BD410DRAFT_806706 [Rickenella mellea]
MACSVTLGTWSQRRDSDTVLPLLRMLESCISIEEFDLCDRSEWRQTDIVTSSITVCLPKLRRLSLDNPLSSTALQLLNHLTLPVLVSSFITGTSAPGLNMPSGFMSVYDSCHVDMSDGYICAGFTCSTNTTLSTDVHLRVPTAEMMSNSFETFRSVFQSAFALLSSINLGFTYGPHAYPTKAWMEFLENLPNLHEFTLRDLLCTDSCDQSAINILHSLSSDRMSTGEHYCPLLRSVTLVNISVKRVTHTVMEDKMIYASTEDGVVGSSAPEAANVRDSLLACVMSRSSKDGRLQKLDISGCQDVDEPLLMGLAPFADEVLPNSPSVRDLKNDFN